MQRIIGKCTLPVSFQNKVSQLPTQLPPFLPLIVSLYKPDWTSQSFRECFTDNIYLSGIALITSIETCMMIPTEPSCQHCNPPSYCSLHYIDNFKSSLATIKVYLSTVWHTHIIAGQHFNHTQQLALHLQQVGRGIQKTQSIGYPAPSLQYLDNMSATWLVAPVICSVTVSMPEGAAKNQTSV